MSIRGASILRLQDYPGGVAQGIRSSLCAGRFEVVTNGPNPEFGFIGSDPYNTNAYTGLVVPATPSAAILNARYLFLLARASFSTGEQSSDLHGVRLVGIRQYAELVARIPAGEAPLLDPESGGPAPGSTVTFRKEITSPLWHPPDGDISWHVMTIPRTQRDTRHPKNTDGIIFQDSLSPALLFQVPDDPTVPTLYSPPNGGRPWGTPLAASLGNIHELRYKWRADNSEYVLDIPIPVPCDVALFASVRQNDPETNPTLADAAGCAVFSALSDEDQFMVAFNNFAQYGSIAGALVFDQNIGEDVP
jgi:hypothetical protein